MRAAIFNPYLDTLGGGERYVMAVASALVKKNFIVDVEWRDSAIREKLEKRFGIDLQKVNFVDDIKRGDGYDVCFWVSDGSIPTLKARKNFLHFQVPFTKVNGNSLLNKFKLMRVNKIICNSNFTKNIIDKEFGVESVVLYPPVSIEKFKPKKKENIILSVARFSSLMQSKRQDVLVKTFAAFHKSNKDWKLILAGGVEVGTNEYMEQLEKEIKEFFPVKKDIVEIIKSPDFKTLKDLFGKAKIFWSAAGFGIDAEKEPKKVEHFGIAPVEAMAAGAIPILFNSGGHRETVENGINGYLWNDPGDLYGFTKRISIDEKLRKTISVNSIGSSKKYSYEEFEKKFDIILD